MLKIIQEKLNNKGDEIDNTISPHTHPCIKSLVVSIKDRDAETYQSNLEFIFNSKEKKYYNRIEEVGQEIKTHCPSFTKI